MPTTLQNSIELPDLSERRDAPIEWWFIQGSARKESGEALHFMAAFFQVHLPGNGHAPAQMLLVHVLNGDGAPGHTASRITPAMITAHEAIARELSRTNFAFPLSHVAFRRHMADTLRFAETNGIRTFETPASLGNAPFSIEWDEFLFTEDAGALSLRLPLNGSGETAELRLEPQRPWLDEEGARLEPVVAPPYRYICCPRLDLAGRWGDTQLTGQAWIDRQWGEFDRWFFKREPNAMRPLGWDWFGLSLENGHDVLLARQVDAGSQSHGAGYALLFSEGEMTRLDDNWSSEVLRHWTSPRTGTTYPIAHRLSIEAMDLQLDIAPVAEDQEIPVFGLPSIWEGAVTASGRMLGSSVRGAGRLELFGYGYADTIPRYMAQQLRRALAG